MVKIIVSVLAFAIVLVVSVDALCHNRKVYQIAEEDFKLNWFMANKHCSSLNMSLVSLRTPDDNYHLEKELKRVAADRTDDMFWTSGNDLGDEDNYYWMPSGESFLFTNWLTAMSSTEDGLNDNIDCVAVKRTKWDPSNSPKWHDLNCYDQHHFICEYYVAGDC